MSGDILGDDIDAVIHGRERDLDWPDPVPIVDARDGLPTFPADVLPGVFADYAISLAEQMQTPVDLPAVMVLGALAAAAGGRAVVEPREGWREPTNLYAVVAMNPAERKSPVVEAVTRPLRAGERDLVESARDGIATAAFEKMLATEAARALMAKAARSDKPDDDKKKAIEASRMAEAIVVPTEPRLLADDATPEALTSLMAAQRGKIAVISAEGGPFDVMAGKYAKMPPLETYLKAHAGDTIRVDRKGRPAEYIERPALTIVVACQPDVLRTIAQREGFRGRGLLARFLYSMPTSKVGHRAIGTDAVPRATADRYEHDLGQLVHVLAGWEDPAVIPFADGANDHLLDFERALEPRLGPDGSLYTMRDWGGKEAGAAVRVAGLLHLAGDIAEGWRRPISPETFDAARQILEYFEAHTRAVLAFMGADQSLEDAKIVLDWITKRAASEERTFTKRDLHRGTQAHFAKAGDLDPPLAVLEDRGWIRAVRQEHHGPGRPQSPTFLIHPETT